VIPLRFETIPTGLNLRPSPGAAGATLLKILTYGVKKIRFYSGTG
jgi:hypothetical protein